MNKIYCNKETDMVEQILKVNTADEFPDSYYPNCYAIIDEEEKVNGYNLKHNKETSKFDVVEGLKPKDEVVIVKAPTTEDYNNLKEENEGLKARLERLEELLNVR